MKAVPRAVLDTNAVVSALVFPGGRLARLRQAWQAARFTPLVSHPTAEELVRVLAYPKFRLDESEQLELLADYLPHCRVVRLPARLPRVPSCPDPGDIPFLQLAVAGKAAALVTGDRDLLALGRVGACAIVRPEAFLATIEAG